jgi:DNA-binding NarL/FixJ family response regulator
VASEESGRGTPLAGGRAALEQADWEGARARFEEAVNADECAEAWEGLSRAAWWLGDQEETLAARERAYRAYQAAADPRGAARMAAWLASDQIDFRGDDAVASAWLQRGRALLAGHPPCSELGYIALREADIALFSDSDPEMAARLAREALELAHGVEDPGVEVLSLALLGSALVASGAVDEGLQRLDEGAAIAVGERFEETAAPGWALCHTVSACVAVGDFDRAAQWCRALHSWSAGWRARHFFGICRTAYGEVLATGGDWPSAEEELVSAVEDLRMTRSALAAPAAVRLGRLRLRQGEVVEARALFEAALPLPSAILALGELDLEGGDAVAAAEAADRVLRRLDEASILDRLPALELLTRASAAAGDADQAKAVAEEIERKTQPLTTPYMRGRSRLARAHALSAAGDHDGARQAAEDAVDLFGVSSAPYEAAEARVLLAAALEALGRLERAETEGRVAREAFALLGARGERQRPPSEELSIREAEILRLVAEGLNDAQIAERLYLSRHTVHRHVANIRTKLRVPSRAAAVAYATREGLL